MRRRVTGALVAALVPLAGAAPASSRAVAPVRVMRSYFATARLAGADGVTWQLTVTGGHAGAFATAGEAVRVEVSFARCAGQVCEPVGVLVPSSTEVRSAVRDNLDAAEMDTLVGGVPVAVRLGGPGGTEAILAIDGVGARERFFVGRERHDVPAVLSLGRLKCAMFDGTVRNGVHIVVTRSTAPLLDELPAGLLTGRRTARCERPAT